MCTGESVLEHYEQSAGGPLYHVALPPFVGGGGGGAQQQGLTLVHFSAYREHF